MCKGIQQALWGISGYQDKCNGVPIPRELPVNYTHSQYLLLCWAALELTLRPGHSYQ